ncbi:MAG TPA: 4-phosphopantoate--beta-alanine ligase [Nitrosopumilaceae archaeon]|nr:4-phosphopantoate--beta-alanine ligase [Nitrosopumilaceae archaeon]
MELIPASHPRAKSLLIREKLVNGFDSGIVAKEGLMAHGRGEAFDYLLGEKTSNLAKKSIQAAAALLLLAKNPVISVNGNIAALSAKEIVQLSKIIPAKVEVNVFYASESRKKNIVLMLKKNGAKTVFGLDRKNQTKIPKLDSARRIVDKNGIFSADVVLVPIEDGDRTIALKKFGKKVITFDLNPLSRTAQTAHITIVDNAVRGMAELVQACKKLSKKNESDLKKMIRDYSNKKNLSENIIEIKKNLTRRAIHG